MVLARRLAFRFTVGESFWVVVPRPRRWWPMQVVGERCRIVWGADAPFGASRFRLGRCFIAGAVFEYLVPYTRRW
jgi:hypothetical protein